MLKDVETQLTSVKNSLESVNKTLEYIHNNMATNSDFNKEVYSSLYEIIYRNEITSEGLENLINKIKSGR